MQSTVLAHEVGPGWRQEEDRVNQLTPVWLAFWLYSAPFSIPRHVLSQSGTVFVKQRVKTLPGGASVTPKVRRMAAKAYSCSAICLYRLFTIVM